MPGTAYIKLDPAKLAALLEGPQGPVLRHIFVKADVVKAGARRRAGRSKPDPLGRPRKYAAHLGDTIVKRMGVVNGKAAVLIVAESPIATWHHEGTQPHVITPRRGKVLRFYAPGGSRSGVLGPAGNVVYARKVHHPGTKPNRFLTDSLADLRGNL